MPCSLSGSETKAGVSGRIQMQRPLPGHRESSSRSTDQPVRCQGPGNVGFPADADVSEAGWVGTRWQGGEGNSRRVVRTGDSGQHL